MDEEKILELLQKLFTLQYDWTSGNDKYTSTVIAQNNRGIVTNAVREFVLENRSVEISELRAKVFVYEQIISNSNFAPVIKSVKSVKIKAGETKN